MSTGIAADESSKDKPNIVLFISDDHGYTDLGCYGNKVVQTPNLDRLAKQGVRFKNAFAGSPLCIPSRAVIYTGLMPFRNGCHHFSDSVYPGTKTLPQYLKRLGYRVVLAGKKHVRPLKAYPFEYVSAHLSGNRALPTPRIYGSDLDTIAVDSLIANHKKIHGYQPLCIIICSWSSHVVWRWKNYNSGKVIVPPYLVDTPTTRDAIARYYTDVTLLDKRLGACLRSIKKYSIQDNTLFIYTSDQGAQFPHAKWNLYDLGIRVPFIVRWPGKVAAGSISDEMISFVDVLPTFVEIAGGTPPCDIDGRSFLSVLLDKAKHHRKAIFATHTGDGSWNDFPIRCIRTPRYKYILNLKPYNLYATHITNGKDRDGRDYWETWLEKAKIDNRAAQVVYMDQHRPAEELYDLRADPYELNNIAYNPANRKLVDSLRKRLEEWMEEQGDPWVDSIPQIINIETKRFIRSPGGG